MSNSRRWCFTHNNYESTEWVDNLSEDLVQYVVCGKEIGESGTPHLQGFIVFKTNKRLSAVKKLHPTVHWEAAKGSAQQASDYCKKDGDYTERGILPKTRQQIGADEQERWRNIRLAAEEGRLDDIEEKERYKNLKLIKAHRFEALKKRKLDDTEEKHEWYYGEAGTGKSKKAREENPDAYLKMCNKWWDGYDDEEVAIIEDFDIEHKCLAHHMKLWGDRYPFLAECKGGVLKIRPRKIIVTSNYHPRDIWDRANDLEPILRRFNITQFTTGSPYAAHFNP